MFTNNESTSLTPTISRSGGFINFSVKQQITEEQAMEMQADLSYPAAGYGFYNYKLNADSTSWSCSNNCD